MWLKLVVVLPLLGVFGPSGTFGIQKFVPWGNAEHSTHGPVLPEGGTFPLRSGQVPLASVNIGDDGSVVMPHQILRGDNSESTSRNLCPGEDIPAMCGTYDLTTGETITITTPNYPQKYPGKFKCSWRFQSTDTEELSLACEIFKLDSKGKDFLGVTHDTSGTETKYKKQDAPLVPMTTGGVLDLRFSSNKKISNTGFKCTITHLGTPTTTTTSSTTTTSTSTTTSTTSTSTTTTTTDPSVLLSHSACGLVNTRIVNGETTQPNQYPWMVWTYLTWSNGRQRWCGGTIIHEQWILTAAHCPYRLNDAQNAIYYPNSIRVSVGTHNKDNPSANSGYVVDADTSEIYLHPKLQMPYDIALYKLKTPLVFTQNVAPICLAPRAWLNNYFEGIPVTLAGWGKTESGGLSTYLRDYDTVGYDYAQCRSTYGSWMGTTQMCTDGSARKHSCAGDSGGPVMRLEDGRVFQVGVISFGGSEDCKDQYPDGQVRVAVFIDWIESVTGLSFGI